MKYLFMALLVGLMTSTNAQVSGFRGIDWGTGKTDDSAMTLVRNSRR